MFCPVCGEDAGDDDRCPSCDADLTQIRDAAATSGSSKGRRQSGSAASSGVGKTESGARAGKGGAAAKSRSAAGGGGGARQQPAASREKVAAGRAAPPTGRSGVRRWLPWVVAAVVLVAAVVIVVVRPGDDAGTPTAQDGGGSSAGAPVADTSGTYDQLVQRANGLYDQGSEQFQSGEAVTAASYFSAAATVYAAAWQKQPGDPNVGTDWATSLFYSGDIDGAIERVDMVLAADSEFQPGYYNRGNYLEHRARGLEEEGDSAGASQARKEAESAFRKAVQIDPKSDVGKAAAKRLKSVSGGQ